MTRNDVLREFIAATRRMPGCSITEEEAKERLAEAEMTKPMVALAPRVYEDIVKKLRAIRA